MHIPDFQKVVARRVFLSLRDEISNGIFKDGVRLPSEHKLADQFDVSRITIRRALEALAADGWIEKKTGGRLGRTRQGPRSPKAVSGLCDADPASG